MVSAITSSPQLNLSKAVRQPDAEEEAMSRFDEILSKLDNDDKELQKNLAIKDKAIETKINDIMALGKKLAIASASAATSTFTETAHIVSKLPIESLTAETDVAIPTMGDSNSPEAATAIIPQNPATRLYQAANLSVLTDSLLKLSL